MDASKYNTVSSAFDFLLHFYRDGSAPLGGAATPLQAVKSFVTASLESTVVENTGSLAIGRPTTTR